VIDRIAVVVGSQVFTESEVEREVRLTEFQNNSALDLSAKARRDAAERLVDQELIREDMQGAGYQQPSGAQADELLSNYVQAHYRTKEEFGAALAKYGIREDELKQQLTWEQTAIQFTQLRFQTGVQAPGDPAASAERSASETANAPSVDQQLEAWLKEARANTRIQFKKEAFQ
jgi:hypothetical protein